MKLILTRRSQSQDPTFGEITYNDKHICYTLELPWHENKPRVSCIPSGEYECEPLLDHKTSYGVFFQESFRVNNVPGRSGILIHPGNFLSDTHGCILVGETTILKNKFLGGSRSAMTKLMNFVDQKPFILEIKTICIN